MASQNSGATTALTLKQQRDHIREHLPDLIEMTELGTYVISIFQKSTLGSSDIACLDSLSNKHDKNMKFYNLIQTRPGFYEVLIEAMEKTSQTGVVELLKSLDVPQMQILSTDSWTCALVPEDPLDKFN